MSRQHGKDHDEQRGFGPKDGRGRFSGRYTREQDSETGGRQFPRDGNGRSRKDREKDLTKREGGERGGYAGSFERESDDYDRSMGRKDRGHKAGGRSSRDDDYVELGKDARFNDS